MRKFSIRPMLLGFMVLALAACASNPFQYAKTPLDKAHVALNSLEIVQTEALKVVQDPAAPAAVVKAIRVASSAATAAATELGGAVIEVEAARAQLIAGTTSSERLRIANTNLLQWTNTLLSRITSIKAALKEARHV